MQKSMSKRIKKLLLLTMGFILISIFMVFALLYRNNQYPSYESNIIQPINELEWNMEGNSTSRTSFITPVTQTCYPKTLSNNALSSFFGYSNYADFLSKDFEHSAIYDGEKLHSVKSKWYFNGTAVHMTVDPNNSPAFLFNGDADVQYINGYKIAARKTSHTNGTYEIDIGLEKDGVGIWVFGDSNGEKQVEELINLVLNSKINLSAL